MEEGICPISVTNRLIIQPYIKVEHAAVDKWWDDNISGDFEGNFIQTRATFITILFIYKFLHQFYHHFFKMSLRHNMELLLINITLKKIDGFIY
jgi:hypothetical protein